MDSGHEGWGQLLSFHFSPSSTVVIDFGDSDPGSHGESLNGLVGNTPPGMLVGLLLPALVQISDGFEDIDLLEVEFKFDESQENNLDTYIHFEMTNVLITSYQTDGSSSLYELTFSDENYAELTEKISIAFEEIIYMDPT